MRQIVNGDKGWVVNGTNVRNLAAAEVVEARNSWDELFNVIKVKPSRSMKLGSQIQPLHPRQDNEFDMLRLFLAS